MPRRVNPQVRYLEPDFWISDYIKNVGDKNDRGSSLKCDVTHWTMHQDEAFWEITEQINVMANDLLIDRCLLYTSPSPRDGLLSRMPSSA